MSKTSILLMGSSGTEENFCSEPVRYDGYWGSTGTERTIAIYLQSFIGRIWIEGSLASEPKDEDWFPIHLGGEVPYVQFPEAPKVSPNNVESYYAGDTGTYAFTIQANLTWIRARVDRSYMYPNPKQNNIDGFDSVVSQLGSVKKILLN